MISFKSSASGTISYHRDVALQLLEMLGRDSKVPSAMYATDVADALQRLEHELSLLPQAEQQTAEAQQDTELEKVLYTVLEAELEAEVEKAEPVISLRIRALPLLTFLQRAIDDNVGISWE